MQSYWSIIPKETNNYQPHYQTIPITCKAALKLGAANRLQPKKDQFPRNQKKEHPTSIRQNIRTRNPSIIQKSKKKKEHLFDSIAWSLGANSSFIQLILVHLLFHVVRPSTKAKYQMICVSYSYSFKFMNLNVVLLQPWVDSDGVLEPHIQLVSDSKTNFYLNSVRFGSLLLLLYFSRPPSYACIMQRSPLHSAGVASA